MTYNTIGRLHFGKGKFAMGYAFKPEFAQDVADAMNKAELFDEMRAALTALTSSAQSLGGARMTTDGTHELWRAANAILSRTKEEG